jgi:o-succinylbenzoate synthase
LEASFQSYKLIFNFDAGTSRGVLKERNTYFIRLWDPNHPQRIAVGEAGPLQGLSPDYADLESKIQILCEALRGQPIPQSYQEITTVLNKFVSQSLPSVRFALETAFYDLLRGANKMLFPGAFTQGSYSIPINGLIWMGDLDFMKDQIDQKIASGYNCIKIKIGAIDFEAECSLLDYIRNRYGQKISLRVDANGAFKPADVHQKLNRLSKFHIHSIEQPVLPGQHKLLRDLCLNPIIPIALDEELIGITDSDQKEALLDSIHPQYIVLKPTLLGGMDATREWIRLADQREIGWWITSALESSIGLNALAQFVATFKSKLPQGLGTGQLYTNNLPSRLYIHQGRLFYRLG